mmetsp:Transcript_37721/g.82581  ORF Transcript_37721/g.82581 Transcript_37721/m.82581 type:complete len:307 (-) Transcript_37721:125-1045(-)
MSKVAVVGSGLMGRGIAACICAGGPHTIKMYDSREDAIQTGVDFAMGLVKFLQDANVPPNASVGTISAAASLEDAVKDADFVFEAVFESVEVKQKVFGEVEGLCKPDTILCTNTSSLSVTEIASNLKTPERMIAAHFIGPAHLVPLVELCPGNASGPDAVPKVHTFLTSCGKKPIIMKKEIDGFIAARLQAALYRECMHLLQSGVADVDAIDSAVVNGFGRRLNQIGPFTVADCAGVDLVQGTHARFFPQLGAYQRDERADELVASGRLGLKSKAGHYDWTDEKAAEVTGRRDQELLRRLQADFAQ